MPHDPRPDADAEALYVADPDAVAKLVAQRRADADDNPIGLAFDRLVADPDTQRRADADGDPLAVAGAQFAAAVADAHAQYVAAVIDAFAVWQSRARAVANHAASDAARAVADRVSELAAVGRANARRNPVTAVAVNHAALIAAAARGIADAYAAAAPSDG